MKIDWRFLMNIYWIFLVAAIVFVLCADKIDRAVHGNKQVKKVILIFSIGVCVICMIPMLMRIL